MYLLAYQKITEEIPPCTLFGSPVRCGFRDILLLSLFSNSKQQSFGNDVSKIGATSMLVKIRTLIFPTHFHWQTALPSIKIKMNELDGIKSNKSEFFKTSDQKLRKSRKSLRTLCTYTWKLSFSCSIKRFLNWSWL